MNRLVMPFKPYTRTYNLQENMKVINRRQEEVILRLEKRLDKYEEKEREREQRGSSSGERRGDKDKRRDDRDHRERSSRR